MNTTERRPRVVVGIDGSGSSAKALAWAEDYAHRAGADLDIVTVWHFPTSYGVAVPISGWDPETDAHDVAAKAAATVHSRTVRVRTRVEHGSAGDALVKASQDADLLVVGCRGHGGFTGMLLGSVSAHCVHHAHCPVVVVR